MGTIEIINFGCTNVKILQMLEKTASEMNLTLSGQEPPAFSKRLLFVIQLDEIGENTEASAFLKSNLENGYFKNSIAAIVVLSSSDLYTKSYSKKWIFVANSLGCEMIGHPLVEITGGYQNFNTWTKTVDEPLETIAMGLIKSLVTRLAEYKNLKLKQSKVLVLHAGHKKISNTLMLWERIESKLSERLGPEVSIKTLHVEEGQIRDCYGCAFETCTYYAMSRSCFYGGFVVESLYPSLEEADYVVWICPNYNDAISAKLMAVVNRLTALYRNMSFHEKYILAVVVSANSGNDVVSSQLIGALNINKGFRLPPKFALMEMANEPGEIFKRESIDSTINNYVNSVFEIMHKNMK
ncbi:MAG: NAD(P)H-dependent oxidoreductase [Bacillota bacterium]|nr:NAD(P)H-dependent oxidoreductase [Bacillota bacterium]